MDSYRRTLFATALGVALALAACKGKPPTSPTPTAPNTPPGAVPIVRLELTGPGTVPIGQTLLFTATAHLTDGTTRNVTADATWGSGNTTVLSLATPGQFTGRAKGQTSVRASLNGQSMTMGEVIVVPEGTFRLSGTVRDAGSPVEANVRIDDEALGVTELTTTQGRYLVYGVRGNTRVIVAKSGYELATTSQVLDSHQAIDFDLALLKPRADVAGRYTLTVTAAPDCRLTTEAASRSYPAVVSQSGTAITVTLDGQQFVTSGGRTSNRFTGVLEAEQASFRLLGGDFNSYYADFFPYPDVFEVLSPNSYYTFEGVAIAAVGPGTLSGALSGSIVTYTGPPYRPSGWCHSTNHRFVLSKATT